MDIFPSVTTTKEVTYIMCKNDECCKFTKRQLVGNYDC